MKIQTLEYFLGWKPRNNAKPQFIVIPQMRIIEVTGSPAVGKTTTTKTLSGRVCLGRSLMDGRMLLSQMSRPYPWSAKMPRWVVKRLMRRRQEEGIRKAYETFVGRNKEFIDFAWYLISTYPRANAWKGDGQFTAATLFKRSIENYAALAQIKSIGAAIIDEGLIQRLYSLNISRIPESDIGTYLSFIDPWALVICTANAEKVAQRAAVRKRTALVHIGMSAEELKTFSSTIEEAAHKLERAARKCGIPVVLNDTTEDKLDAERLITQLAREIHEATES